MGKDTLGLMNANAFKNFSQPLERYIRMPIVFTLVILYQGLFSGGAIEMPAALEGLLKNRFFRFLSLFLVALGATQDVEYAVFATVVFLGFIYLIRTPEERAKNGFV